VAAVLTQTYTTVAALHSRSGSPFVLPTGSPKPWQRAASIPADTTGVSGSAHGTRNPDSALMVVNPATMAGVDARVATKQDRPPRGVPR
jgi:hypothetical protein